MTPNLYSSIIGQLTARFAKDEAQAMARILIEDLLHLSLPHVLAGIIPPLSVQEGLLVKQAVSRLLDNEPIQYVIGSTTFCGNTFCVNPSVLIPRPETEQLVDMAIDIADLPEHVSIMDACTGSGCIAISIKKKRPDWEVYACDISAEALQTARENAKANGAEVHFTHTDVLSDKLLTGPFDIMVSNPPYVMDKEKSSMEPHVLKREPHLALFVTDDEPLIFYRALAQWGQRSLSSEGWMLAEINPLLSQETKALFEAQQYRDCTIINDNYGKERFIRCRK
ncbi:MAG: peptide chain release factor N(5)-glutamine methyltransferase [Bacteroidaceae bacterium]|nr:peptide chain release factor N(5)-glutamine methyltransferase [Bacteroidaceae bacterium]